MHGWLIMVIESMVALRCDRCGQRSKAFISEWQAREHLEPSLGIGRPGWSRLPLEYDPSQLHVHEGRLAAVDGGYDRCPDCTLNYLQEKANTPAGVVGR